MINKCPECKENKVIFDKEKNEFICTGCGYVVESGKKQRFALRVELVPIKKEKIVINKFKDLIFSFENADIDHRFIKNKNQEDCYYKINIEDENICIEINYGNKGVNDEIKRISIVTQPRIPSEKTFSMFVELVKCIQNKFSIEILDSETRKIISVGDLIKIYNSIKDFHRYTKYGGYKKII